MGAADSQAQDLLTGEMMSDYLEQAARDGICVSLFVSLYLCLSRIVVCLCLSICVSLSGSFYLCLSICLPLSVSLYPCLSICVSLSHSRMSVSLYPCLSIWVSLSGSLSHSLLSVCVTAVCLICDFVQR